MNEKHWSCKKQHIAGLESLIQNLLLTVSGSQSLSK